MTNFEEYFVLCRTLLASCEPEVKEVSDHMMWCFLVHSVHCSPQLMHQLDVLLTSRQKEEEVRLQGLRAQLQVKERELSTLRVALAEKTSRVSI